MSNSGAKRLSDGLEKVLLNKEQLVAIDVFHAFRIVWELELKIELSECFY
jgi:hypothetical protein